MRKEIKIFLFSLFDEKDNYKGMPIKKFKGSEFSSEFKETQTNQQYYRKAISEKSIRLADKTPENKTSVISINNNTCTNMRDDCKVEDHIILTHSLSDENCNDIVDFDNNNKQIAKSNANRNSIVHENLSFDRMITSPKNEKDQCEFNPMNGEENFNHCKDASSLELSENEKSESQYLNHISEFSMNEISPKKLDKYMQTNNKQFCSNGASEHKYCDKAYNLRPDVSSEYSKSIHSIEFQHNLYVQDHQKYMSNQT